MRAFNLERDALGKEQSCSVLDRLPQLVPTEYGNKLCFLDRTDKVVAWKNHESTCQVRVSKILKVAVSEVEAKTGGEMSIML